MLFYECCPKGRLFFDAGRSAEKTDRKSGFSCFYGPEQFCISIWEQPKPGAEILFSVSRSLSGRLDHGFLLHPIFYDIPKMA